MQAIISLITRFRAIMATTATFQRTKATEFIACIYIIASKLTGSNCEPSVIMKLKDLLVLGESISTEGGVTKEKTIKAFDIVLSQMSDVFNSCKVLSDTAIAGDLDSIERLIEASGGKTPPLCDIPSNTISMDDLQEEKGFLAGYKAINIGKLVFVALFDDWPSWHGTQTVNSISLDEATCLEFKVVKHECKSVLSSLSACRNDEIEYRRLILRREAGLRDRLMTAAIVIARHVHELVRAHSNLIAVEPCWTDGHVMIRFLVTCKHYVPVGEMELPVQLDGFRTCVQQEWFHLTGFCGGLAHQSSLKPGCALSAEHFSGRQDGDLTFGTVGGYVTMNGASYAVTVGHLFRTSVSASNNDMVPSGSQVVANPLLAQVMCRYISEGYGDQVDIQSLYAMHGCRGACDRMQRYCALSREEANDAIMTCGTLVGCQFGVPNSNGNVVDVAVIRCLEGSAVPFDGNGWKMYSEEEGITIPSLEIKLDENFNPTNAVLLGEESAIGRQAHGYGAFTSADIQVLVLDNYTTFVVDKARHIFQCFRGTVKNGGRTLRPGDSGTWFWCTDSSLLGMGIGVLGNDTMILPMTDVVTTVVDILHPDRVLKRPQAL